MNLTHHLFLRKIISTSPDTSNKWPICAARFSFLLHFSLMVVLKKQPCRHANKISDLQCSSAEAPKIKFPITLITFPVVYYGKRETALA